MSKHLTPLYVNKRAFKINTLHVEAMAHKYFNISYADANKNIQSKIRDKIKELLVNKKELSAQIIEDAIFLKLLPNKLKKELSNLAYLQVL
jgi:predicted phage-related endonuclease